MYAFFFMLVKVINNKQQWTFQIFPLHSQIFQKVFFPSSFQSNEQIPRPRPKSTTMGLSLRLESIDFHARQKVNGVPASQQVSSVPKALLALRPPPVCNCRSSP
jgi:hypothetical protein